MTRYTVVWHALAIDELTDLWTKTDNRRHVSESVNTIDRELSIDAHLKGVVIHEEIRWLAVPPVQILFSVSEPDRIAKVLKILNQE